MIPYHQLLYHYITCLLAKNYIAIFYYLSTVLVFKFYLYEKTMQNIILVGVGGTGLSSLAYLFHDLWYTNIIGIDKNPSEITKKLKDYGVSVIIWDGKNYQVQKDDLIIYSDAAENTPEVKQAKAYVGKERKRISPPFSYFQFLWEISRYFQTISIAWTHGKSTTTALTWTVFSQWSKDFWLAICGAPVTGWENKNYILNTSYKKDIKAIIDHIISPKWPQVWDIMKKYFFIIEADEYNHHFLYLDTDYAIITNIELDHADVYENFENYLDTFQQFTSWVRKDIFVLPDASGIQSLQDMQDRGNKIRAAKNMKFSFKTLLWAHNHDNASLAFAFMKYLSPEQSLQTIQESLKNFTGLRRRGEFLGNNKYGVPIITDYGHHPTELMSTYKALCEKYPNKKITCIFQPHQARRVIEFRESFTETLQKFDTTIIYDIYAARENLEELKKQFYDKNFLDSVNSFKELGEQFAHVSWGNYVTNFQEIKNTLETINEGIIIIFTAGNLDREVRKWIK